MILCLQVRSLAGSQSLIDLPDPMPGTGLNKTGLEWFRCGFRRRFAKEAGPAFKQRSNLYKSGHFCDFWRNKGERTDE
jgi:hypothetical protein